LIRADVNNCPSDIKDRYGNRIGRLDGDGTKKDEYGNVIGRMGKDGTIKDKYGNRNGCIDDYKRRVQ